MDSVSQELNKGSAGDPSAYIGILDTGEHNIPEERNTVGENGVTFTSCFMFRSHMVPLLALSRKSYISALRMAIHLLRTFESPASVSERV